MSCLLSHRCTCEFVFTRWRGSDPGDVYCDYAINSRLGHMCSSPHAHWHTAHADSRSVHGQRSSCRFVHARLQCLLCAFRPVKTTSGAPSRSYAVRPSPQSRPPLVTHRLVHRFEPWDSAPTDPIHTICPATCAEYYRGNCAPPMPPGSPPLPMMPPFAPCQDMMPSIMASRTVCTPHPEACTLIARSWLPDSTAAGCMLIAC